MAEGLPQYDIGGWVVHQAYGIGQIKKIEVRPIHGKQVKCFRVKTKDGAFWFPKNRPDNPRIRPVVTPDIIQRVIKELGEPVVDLDPDRKMWKKRIDEVKASDDLIAASQMVRDLTILRTQRKLNQTEETALKDFTDSLLYEWSAAMNMDIGVVRRKLNNYLQACKEHASV
jgi:RNA polymerase-interacting CarD/CdnL/TRCF family regulator